jgi:hypothetical protein
MNFKGGFWNVQNVQNGVQVVSQFLDDIAIISPSYPHCIPVLVSYNPHVGVIYADICYGSYGQKWWNSSHVQKFPLRMDDHKPLIIVSSFKETLYCHYLYSFIHVLSIFIPLFPTLYD